MEALPIVTRMVLLTLRGLGRTVGVGNRAAHLRHDSCVNEYDGDQERETSIMRTMLVGGRPRPSGSVTRPEVDESFA